MLATKRHVDIEMGARPHRTFVYLLPVHGEVQQENKPPQLHHLFPLAAAAAAAAAWAFIDSRRVMRVCKERGTINSAIRQAREKKT